MAVRTLWVLFLDMKDSPSKNRYIHLTVKTLFFHSLVNKTKMFFSLQKKKNHWVSCCWFCFVLFFLPLKLLHFFFSKFLKVHFPRAICPVQHKLVYHAKHYFFLLAELLFTKKKKKNLKSSIAGFLNHTNILTFI